MHAQVGGGVREPEPSVGASVAGAALGETCCHAISKGVEQAIERSGHVGGGTESGHRATTGGDT